MSWRRSNDRRGVCSYWKFSLNGMSIPILDISSVNRHGLEGSLVVQDMHAAFTTVGFVFITGHGIPRELVSSYQWAII